MNSELETRASTFSSRIRGFVSGFWSLQNISLTSGGEADSFQILDEGQNHAVMATFVSNTPTPEKARFPVSVLRGSKFLEYRSNDSAKRSVASCGVSFSFTTISEATATAACYRKSQLGKTFSTGILTW